MDVDAVIEAGVAASASEAQPQADATQPIEEVAQSEAAEPDAHAEKEEAFPKKAVNAISYRDKQIGKLRAKLEHEQAARIELERRYISKPPVDQPQNKGEPKEADFDNYADFMAARNAYLIDQKFSERDTKQTEQQKAQQQQAYYQDLYVKTQARSDEFMAATPDAQTLFDEHSDLIESCPDNIYTIFLESGDAPLAAYNLIKQGKLEEVISMSPARAAIAIGRALAQTPIPPKTKAPAPLPATRGSVATTKPLEAQSVKQLMNTFVYSKPS